MKCLIKIFGGNDRGGEYKSDGEIEFTLNGFWLLYELNGDKCELSFDGQTVTQKRKGAFSAEMLFAEGKETVCKFYDGGYTGELPVYTNKIALTKSGLNIKLSLDYLCGGERSKLDLSAEVIQEKK
ncbi:MAG: DUF1934 domain-containing protein [Clostridia bacterium]|nr:DUF1934 domain-containing protein [Clostridia bacterium]